MKKVLLLEPFFTGSHQSWAEGLRRFSGLEVKILCLPGRHWKWRMHAGSVALAQQFLALKDYQPDMLLATDMLDLPTFLGLTRQRTSHIPVAIYFHENQITYPWSETDPDVNLKRDNHYGYLNFKSAVVADVVFFNSTYHKRSFLEALPTFLAQFPDYQGIEYVAQISDKSRVLHLGINLNCLDEFRTNEKLDVPLLVWNHRWEYDKNPTAFFKALFQLKAEKVAFKLAVLGRPYKNTPAIFGQAKAMLKNEIVHFGRAKQFADYAHWLWKADIIPITNNQDFFGQSVVEGIYCNCCPILPKRLAYPEHIPAPLHAQFFYETTEEFYQILKNALQKVNLIRKESYQSFVKHYDWRILAPLYDKALLEI